MTRLIGIDIARALAMFGMVIVNYNLILNANHTSDAFTLARLFEGRAAALFVVLAGVGISLMSARARKNSDSGVLAKIRLSLLKRAFLLFVIGLAYLPVWPADILHFYAVYIAVAAFLFAASNRVLLIAGSVLGIGFLFFLFLGDYARGWNFDDLSYARLWTLSGGARNLFFNGFHPLLPWGAFLIYGIWLGRMNFSDAEKRRGSFAISLVTVVVATILSKLGQNQWSPESIVGIFMLKDMMPPMPLYLITASATATCVLLLCVELGIRFPKNILNRPLAKTGEHALTHYVGHIILGIGILEAYQLLDSLSANQALFASLAYCVFALGFSNLWALKFKSGPLEFLFRKLAK